MVTKCKFQDWCGGSPTTDFCIAVSSCRIGTLPENLHQPVIRERQLCPPSAIIYSLISLSLLLQSPKTDTRLCLFLSVQLDKVSWHYQTSVNLLPHFQVSWRLGGACPFSAFQLRVNHAVEHLNEAITLPVILRSISSLPSSEDFRHFPIYLVLNKILC